MRTIYKGQRGETAPAWHEAVSHWPKLVVMGMSALLWLEEVMEKRRSRRALLRLTDEQLKDIGISRADAIREARRSRWL